jgi:hypothetical protein
MNEFSAVNNKTNTQSTTVPMWCLTGGTTRRLAIFEMMFGSDATPDDQVAKYQLMRTSARGTQSTTITPNPLNPATPAAVATFDTAWSVDPTITASSQQWQQAVNQRVSYRWLAGPDGEYIIPATAGAGLALIAAVVTTAFNAVFSTHWRE